jgi:hypothetical protein
MARSLVRLCLGLALVVPALSTPTSHRLGRRGCSTPTCALAAFAGSSGEPFDPATPPAYGTDAGDCCVLSYNPAAAGVLYAEKPGLQALCAARGSTQPTKRERGPDDEVRPMQRRACTPYTLLYSRATDELGAWGETVGVGLYLGLLFRDGWTAEAIDYDADADGDNCLGLPGGAYAAQVLESVAAGCPDTKIVMAGYSQGCAVTHNASAAPERGVRGRR